MPQFSTNETVSLEKQVDLCRELMETNPDNISEVYEISRCADWIKANNFQKVCLQFPDHLLPDSSAVAEALQNILGQTVYILGDTAYESCCIDYIAAAHISADAVIHYGPVCFSKTSANISFLNIYEKFPLDVDKLRNCVCDSFIDTTDTIVVVVDSPYIYKIDKVKNALENFKKVRIQRCDENDLNIKGFTTLVVGENQRKLFNMVLTLRPSSLYYYSTDTERIVKFEPDSKVLKRRYFLIEKIKDSKTIGIVIGTLGVKNYLTVIERVKKLIELCGKKYYLISVGKPTVAKLANFPEIDIYVMITCAMNEIYDSRDFYKPIATPYDIEIALNASPDENISFSYDYNSYLTNLSDLCDLKTTSNHDTDVSLLSGQIRSNMHEGNPQKDAGASENNQLIMKGDGALALNSSFGAGFLNERTWKGLEQKLGENEATIATEGRSGIAGSYHHEQSV